MNERSSRTNSANPSSDVNQRVESPDLPGEDKINGMIGIIENEPKKMDTNGVQVDFDKERDSQTKSLLSHLELDQNDNF